VWRLPPPIAASCTSQWLCSGMCGFRTRKCPNPNKEHNLVMMMRNGGCTVDVFMSWAGTAWILLDGLQRVDVSDHQDQEVGVNNLHSFC